MYLITGSLYFFTTFFKFPPLSNFLLMTLFHSSVGKESTCNTGDPSSIPGLGRSAGEGIGYPLQYSWAFLVAQLIKNPPIMWETWIRSLGWNDPLKKGMTTHPSILAWRITWVGRDFHFLSFFLPSSWWRWLKPCVCSLALSWGLCACGQRLLVPNLPIGAVAGRLGTI